jgi:hypothetical protein
MGLEPVPRVLLAPDGGWPQWLAAQPSPAPGNRIGGKLPSSRTSFYVADW